jgi:fucose 4-O-acetylase-like acetyltransferase
LTEREILINMNRDPTVDIAKGIAIIAIVLGQVLRGLSSAGILDAKTVQYQLVDRSLYMFHLSVFALLAGLFV